MFVISGGRRRDARPRRAPGVQCMLRSGLFANSSSQDAGLFLRSATPAARSGFCRCWQEAPKGPSGQPGLGPALPRAKPPAELLITPFTPPPPPWHPPPKSLFWPKPVRNPEPLGEPTPWRGGEPSAISTCGGGESSKPGSKAEVPPCGRSPGWKGRG